MPIDFQFLHIYFRLNPIFLLNSISMKYSIGLSQLHQSEPVSCSISPKFLYLPFLQFFSTIFQLLPSTIPPLPYSEFFFFTYSTPFFLFHFLHSSHFYILDFNNCRILHWSILLIFYFTYCPTLYWSSFPIFLLLYPPFFHFTNCPIPFIPQIVLLSFF